MIARAFAACLVSFLFATPSFAAQCGGDFNAFIASFSREAAAAGISQGVISQALGGVSQDQAVLAFDRRQRGTFKKSFEQYVATRVGAGRIKTGRAMLQRHAAVAVPEIEPAFAGAQIERVAALRGGGRHCHRVHAISLVMPGCVRHSTAMIRGAGRVAKGASL